MCFTAGITVQLYLPKFRFRKKKSEWIITAGRHNYAFFLRVNRISSPINALTSARCDVMLTVLNLTFK